jgi:hypothetical protein
MARRAVSPPPAGQANIATETAVMRTRTAQRFRWLRQNGLPANSADSESPLDLLGRRLAKVARFDLEAYHPSVSLALKNVGVVQGFRSLVRRSLKDGWD